MSELTHEEIIEVRDYIANALNEKSDIAYDQIFRIVQVLGRTACYDLLDTTIRYELDGGMMLPDGSRRRSMGGVFFYLARGRLRGQDVNIFPNAASVRVDYGQMAWEDRIEEAFLMREDQLHQPLILPPRITLAGRPVTWRVVGHTTILFFTYSFGTEKYLQHVPQPETGFTTDYLVLLPTQHWVRVHEALLQSPGDYILVEGTCLYDAEVQALTVLALGITTYITNINHRLLRWELDEYTNPPALGGDDVSGGTAVLPPTIIESLSARQAKHRIDQLLQVEISQGRDVIHAIKQRLINLEARSARLPSQDIFATPATTPIQKGQNTFVVGDKPKKEPNPPAKPAQKEKQKPAQPAPKQSQPAPKPKPQQPAPKPQTAPKPVAAEPAPLTARMSAEDKQKLEQLYQVAETLRERVASMEAKNQSGVAMTKKLLENTLKQIEDLEKKYK